MIIIMILIVIIIVRILTILVRGKGVRFPFNPIGAPVLYCGAAPRGQVK